MKLMRVLVFCFFFCILHCRRTSFYHNSDTNVHLKWSNREKLTVECAEIMPLAFPSGIVGGAAVAKDNWNLFPFSLTVADNNNTGQNLSLLNHLVSNRNLKAGRIGSRLPTRVDR